VGRQLDPKIDIWAVAKPVLRRMAEATQSGHRQTVFAVFAVGLIVTAALLLGMQPAGPHWWGVHWAVWPLSGLGLIAGIAAWPRRG
jgi:hypothetical protein